MSQQTILDNSLQNPKSVHDLSFNWLGSADFGRIIPFHVQELIEGDKIRTCKPRIEMQMLPLASPTFGKMDIYVHYFFVPHRLVFKHFSDVHTQSGPNAGATFPYWTKRDFYTAYLLAGDSAKRALFKHWTSFGLPPFFTDPECCPTTSASSNDRLTTLPFRAYNRIWWDYYRDPEVLPDSNIENFCRDDEGHDPTSASLNQYYPKMRFLKDIWFSQLFASNGVDMTPARLGSWPSASDANGSGIAQSTIRQQEAILRMAERLSLGGKRKIDRYFSMYGVTPNYEKMQMSQYVGGAKSSVLVSDITASATTNLGGTEIPEGSVLGQKAGAGYCALSQLNIKFEAHEPGYLMGVFSVVPHIHFVQGIDKKWYRNGIDDFFRKELQHVGQVAVSKQEVASKYFCPSSAGSGYSSAYDTTKDKETFAFCHPYYEYTRNHDVLAGDFMMYHPIPHIDPLFEQDLTYMQSMGQFVDFPVDRLFNPENLQMKSYDFNKIFYYQGGDVWENVDDHFHVNIDIDCVAVRPMDGYAVPTLETTEDPHASKAPVGNSTVL